MTTDLTKPLMTRDGKKVVIHTRKGMNKDTPIVGEYQDKDGKWTQNVWRPDGRVFTYVDSELDLVNPKNEVWELYNARDHWGMVPNVPKSLEKIPDGASHYYPSETPALFYRKVERK